ncbi:MAG: hypothetical protein HKL92_03760 [Candidatus Eremiobacteraeota bacterium]|nr:hypothetical protein [Candidatus Eremiobacteraeota bacterium]NNM92435.1 hypothetical protein [Candidatus Eremiobacteraeota bacterium]
MNAPEFLDRASALAIGEEWLAAAIAPCSPYGARDVQIRRRFLAGEERQANAQAARIARIAERFDLDAMEAVRATLARLPDIAPALARVAVGDSLDDAQALALLRFADGAIELQRRLAECRDLPDSAGESVDRLRALFERGRVGSHAFYLHDSFDDALRAERERFEEARARFESARGRLERTVAESLGRAARVDEEFIVMRDALVAPLPAGVRVVREAPTYLLCEIDLDEETRALLERREDAARGVALAEERVRASLAQRVSKLRDGLVRTAMHLGEIDAAIAAALWTRRFACRPAEISSESGIEVVEGRWLPLQERLERGGGAFVPSSLSWSGAAIVTGPNMGGKSVALRTVGFIALCASMGLPVPAQRARLALPPMIRWLGIGPEEESRGGLLSSFAGEAVRLRDAFTILSPRALLLVDEFARTTTPRESFAILVASLHAARERGAEILAATHLAGVAVAAGARHFAVRGLRGIPARKPGADIERLLVALADCMDYRIEEVAEDRRESSDALALASLLGVDEEIVARARAIVKTLAE